jgi:hypothetical protein
MGVQLPNTLKSWFVTYAKPVQEQFADWIDSFRHKSEKIGINDLTNELQAVLQNIGAPGQRMQELLLNADGSFNMLAKYKLATVDFKNESDNAMLVTVGLTPGGSELGEYNINAGATAQMDLSKTFWNDTTIYVSGVTGPLRLLIDRR